MQASFSKYLLQFKQPAGTSRGVMLDKETWFLKITQDGRSGIGECGILRGLSADDSPEYEQKLEWTCANIHLGPDKLWEMLKDFPSIQFGVEMAFTSLASSDPMLLFPSEFTKGKSVIPINGLVWMGSEEFMLRQIREKTTDGYYCIKLKIGAIDFEREMSLLKFIRTHFSPDQVEIRVDANGGFSPHDALEKLKRLSEFQIHSIEQPIAAGQWDQMASLCAHSPIPIALDEELIGVSDEDHREKLLAGIKPQYLIFKPSFIGGFRGSAHWMELCEKYQTGWWITSALESNIGLNAIAQWTYSLGVKIPQGLGTGALYTNNVDAPLVAASGFLRYDPSVSWGEWPV